MNWTVSHQYLVIMLFEDKKKQRIKTIWNYLWKAKKKKKRNETHTYTCKTMENIHMQKMKTL